MKVSDNFTIKDFFYWDIIPIFRKTKIIMKLNVKIPKTVQELVSKIVDAGGEVFLVGGAVRDAIVNGVNTTPEDIDLEIYGIDEPTLMKVINSKAPIGKSHEIYLYTTKDGVKVDLSFPRREIKIGSGHKDFKTEADPYMSKEEASSRRDFTINSMMLNLSNFEVVDPHGGLQDLKKKILRPTSKRFAEDALRVLRGMRFAARFDLTPTSGLLRMSKKLLPEADLLSSERISTEFVKMFKQADKIGTGLDVLKQSGWLTKFGSLDNLQPKEWKQTLEALDRTAKLCTKKGINGLDRVILLFAVLLHKTGDSTKNFMVKMNTIQVRYHKKVETLVKFNQTERSVSLKEFRHIYSKLGTVTMDVYLTFLDGVKSPVYRQFLKYSKSVSLEDIKPKVTGDIIMDRGVKQGPEVGKLYKQLYTYQLDNGASKEELLKLLAELTN